MSRKSWIEESFYKRECVKFIPSSRDLHRCTPVCQVCQNLIRCCCGRLMGEHSWQDCAPPISLCPDPGQDLEEDWSIERHTKASLTDAYGVVDFEDTATRVCRAKYIRVAVDSKPELLLQLMLREWQMDRPKLLLTVQGGSKNFHLAPKVKQAFSKGLLTAALSTGAWILTDGINTGVSKYVGEAVKIFGGHDLRKRNTVGVTPWGVIENNVELIGKDVFRPYQPLGNPLSKRACLNGFHSHFLLVDDGTLGKHGCQQGLRKRLERHIQLQKIHPRLNQGVPVVCVVVEGGPTTLSTVLEYVSSAPPVPVFVLEGSGRAADLIAFVHKQTAMGRQLDSDIRDNFLKRIEIVFRVGRAEAFELYNVLLQCMDHRQSITIFDSESDDHLIPDAAILTTALKGTKATPAEQLGMALAWDRADIAQKEILVAGQHWQVGSLEQALLDALVMDRVSFVKLLIDNGMTMSRFLTVDRLEELYNTLQGQTDCFLHHLIEDVKQSTSLPRGYRLSIIDVGLVIENLIGGAYYSTYTRKQFRAAYSRLQEKETRRESTTSFSKQRRGLIQNSARGKNIQDQHFFRMAQPHKPKDQDLPSTSSGEISTNSGPAMAPLPVSFNFNDLFVWAVLYQRQQMALFLWQHGEEALARAIVACKLYRSMAFKARQSSLDDDIAERLKTYSIEFGQLAVDVLDSAFRQNEQMAMKLLTSEMEAWSHFTCLQMAVSSCHRPFVSHSCTQTLLTDLWTGPLNMRKNSVVKIILSLLVPPAILLLEFKSKAEMCHVPQAHETMLFGLDSVKSSPPREENDNMDTEQGLTPQNKYLGSVSEPFSLMTARFLSWIPRLYEFYTAPVVKFWFHTMSYLGFLMLFSFVTLVKMEDKPNVQEWLVIAYILSTAVEKTREVLMSEPRKLSHKLKIWFSEYWNISDFIGILLFLVGLSMRWYGDPYRTAGRICYCLDIIFWFVRVMDLLAVNQHAGPYLTMITKMTRNMFFIVVMMAIVLLSFGVSRKAILSPSEEPSWSLARDVVFQPYWMIYGEVYAGEIDVCGKGKPCPPAAFLTPFLQAVYLFFQYIIMVNILIAFFNNIYFDMASTSNKIWKYNRYRYIMTYQDRPWLPPPLIILSHMTLVLRATYRRFSGGDEQEESGSGLKLLLGHEDHKKLHEFEEKCVESYIHDKNEGLDNSQASMIRATAERAEDMSTIVGEVSEKVDFIQGSLSELDSQLGQLQDLSALAVDTLTLLSATDSVYQEEARLAHCTPAALSQHALPHSWTLPHRSAGPSLRRMTAMSCKSTPPSLLKGATLVSSRLRSQERHVTTRGNREAGPDQDGEGAEETSYETCGPSYCGHPAFLRCMESLHSKPWTCDTHLYTSQEETSMEEGEERGGEEDKEEEEYREELKEEEERKLEELSISGVSRASSDADLLAEPQNVLEGLVNPSFSREDSPTGFHSIPSSQCRRPAKSHKVASLFRDGPYSYCRSLSSSVENMTFSGAPPSQTDGSVPEPAREARDERGLKSGNSCLQRNREREWSKSSDFTQLKCKDKFQSKKTVKIKETDVHMGTMYSHMSDAGWRGGHRVRGEPRCWSASTSLNQLNFEMLDLVQKQLVPHQDVWSPSDSALSSWARPMSRRSSLIQSGIAAEGKTSFQSTENLYPHYSAVERNNLMRLANTIPFTPVSSLGGEEVSIYSLEEVHSDPGPDTASSWSSRGLSALLQPLSSEEGSLDGGLRQGCRVLCTWAEQEVLTPGLVYVVKAFRPEVVRACLRHFHGSTALQLCIRDIQQQRAAQKMMQVFNQVKPDDMRHSPRFLDVSLALWHSNGQWLTIERNLCGHFRKYNNNTGEEIPPCCMLEEMLLAFSHWTYEYSCRELLVLDIQGVGEELTDPTVIMADDKSGSRGDMLFGPDNLGDVAISGFLQKHLCNPTCQRLGLSPLKDPE